MPEQHRQPETPAYFVICSEPGPQIATCVAVTDDHRRELLEGRLPCPRCGNACKPRMQVLHLAVGETHGALLWDPECRRWFEGLAYTQLLEYPQF